MVVIYFQNIGKLPPATDFEGTETLWYRPIPTFNLHSKFNAAYVSFLIFTIIVFLNLLLVVVKWQRGLK